MKTKFILAAFAAVTMFASCTEEALNPDGTKKGKDEGLTAVTFKLNLKQPEIKSKAADFLPDLPVGAAANEQLINPSQVHILIFNSETGVLEVKEPMTNNAGNTESSFTAVLEAGVKKIFVLANCDILGGDYAAWFAGLTVGNTYTLATFPGTGIFNAGAPQFVPFVDKTGNRTFDITPLYTQVGGFGLPASTTNQFSYKLNTGVGIGESVAADLTTDPMTLDGTTYSQKDNGFEIDMYFMVSKARLTLDATALSYTAAKIDNLTYSIHNMARRTSYILNVVGNQGRSAIFGNAFSNSSAAPLVLDATTYANVIPAMHYLDQFDSAIDADNETVGPYQLNIGSDFIFVPEATHGGMTKGMVPYYAITGDYLPKAVVNSVTWNPTAVPPLPKTVFTTLDYSDPGYGGSTDYVYIRKDIVGFGGEIAQGTCFTTLALLQQAVWLVTQTNTTSPAVGGGWTAAAGQITDAMLLIGDCPPKIPTAAEYLAWPLPNYGYYTFEGGQSWWRANVGGTIDSPLANPGPGEYYGNFTGVLTFGNPDNDGWGTLRGVAYDATISEFKGPGVPYEWMLDTEKPEPLNAQTEVTITVKIMDWAHATADPVVLE